MNSFLSWIVVTAALGQTAGGGFAPGPLKSETPVVREDARAVSIELSILEVDQFLTAGDIDTAEKAIARVQELESQGRMVRRTRMRLSTLDGSPATVQDGQRVSISSGRNARADVVVAQRAQNVFQRENIGTLVKATPAIQEDGGVLIEFTVEKSEVEMKQRDPANPEDETTPSGINTLTAASTVRLNAGKPTIAFEKGTKGERQYHAIVLVTANVTGLTGNQQAKSVPDGDRLIEVFSLTRINAEDAVKLIGEKFDDGSIQIISDLRTNNVIVRGSREQLDQVGAVLSKLDEAE